MATLSERLVSAVLLLGSSLALCGCPKTGPSKGDSDPFTKSWPADTIQAPDRASLVRLEVTNIHVSLAAPPGLIVEVPKGSKAVAQKMFAKGASAKGANLPQEIETPSGGLLSWFYGSIPPEQREAARAAADRMAREGAPTGTLVAARPWVGLYTEGERQADVAAILGHPDHREGRQYMLVTADAQLMLNAFWLKGNSNAKREAIEAAEAFIKTVVPNPGAKKVDIFAGAGKETNRPIPKGTEIAMSDGMSIRATTPVGVIRIDAGPDLKRSYTWEGATRFVIMNPRGERWYGSKGLYYPGPGDHWEEHNGITRGVVEEGQQHFKTQEEALAWLKERSDMPYVYTKDGLVVGWQKVLDRRQLNVDVWQIMIAGKKPSNLPGAEDSKIVISHGKRGGG